MHPAYPKTHFIAADGPHDWPEQFAIITAYATTGEVWTDQQNEAADQALEAELRATGRWMRRITGYSPPPATPHREPGWAVAMDWQDACDLGVEVRFLQDAANPREPAWNQKGGDEMATQKYLDSKR
jgi:hypothetical protein